MSTPLTMSKVYGCMMQRAEQEAKSLHDNHLDTHHIVLALLADSESKAGEVLRRNGITYPLMRLKVIESIGYGETPNPTRFYHDYMTMAGVLRIATKIATKYQHTEITPEHFLLALLIFGFSPGASLIRVIKMSQGDPDGSKWMADLGLQVKEVVEQLA